VSHIWNTLEHGRMGMPAVDASAEFGVPEGTAVLYNVSALPDVVRMPAELGGRVLRVLGRTSFPGDCPNCKKRGLTDGYDLEDRYIVGACAGCKFYMWARRPKEASAAASTGTR